ncbi:hypothetical protein GCM10017779_63050 [Streptomyces capillispiralis]|nr:hypothetical protein GCM10017779_63050 [Streptomyces capillispiralis]
MRRNRPAGFSERGTALISEAYRGALTVTYPLVAGTEPAAGGRLRGHLADLHFSKRYPMPGSVMRCCGCDGSASSFRRSCAMYTRR